MSYSCYARYEGDGLVEVSPIVTLHFEDMHAITRNRVRRYLENNYCQTSWSSKASAIINALKGHHNVYESLLHPDVVAAAGEAMDELKASVLLVDHEIKTHNNASSYWYRHAFLRYTGDLGFEDKDRIRFAKHAGMLIREKLIPAAQSLINEQTCLPVLDAIEHRHPYTFQGTARR